MVDVMLVLLIIFMVITPMLRPDSLVEMAKTNNPVEMSDAGKADALIVSVMRDGKVFLGGEKVTSQTLTQRLQDKLSTRVNKMSTCERNARARYGC